MPSSLFSSQVGVSDWIFWKNYPIRHPKLGGFSAWAGRRDWSSIMYCAVGSYILHSSSATENEKNYRKNQPDHEQDPGDVCSGACNSGKSKDPGNQRNDKKCYGPSKHDLSPFFCMFNLICSYSKKEPLDYNDILR
jgi:hypothetical protein